MSSLDLDYILFNLENFNQVDNKWILKIKKKKKL